MYYIAYGSNLNKEEMKQRCKDAKFVSLARLENYTLTYRGNPGRAYLTVDKKKGDFVRVAVWDVSENDKKSLDEYLRDRQTVICAPEYISISSGTFREGNRIRYP